ncbi:unnamed protein product [Rotaria magnacalcarata]|uniref:F-box domain-containing protein n=1 Tax=Rotaria magnacalcarata TaxID=392030 RepID=A0A816RPG7_9BILA|nr:unnamed protein product [Rotaria magnacalcarata]CAF3777623.1 unnamed protein product [Rotaria magnacalcarata]
MASSGENKLPCLDSLPVEILYRILDHLDGHSIILSFRYVCKKFAAVTNTYNRYKLDFTSISKTDCHVICRAIKPENVIDLTISDGDMTPGQISLFLSLVTIDRYIKLRSLTLLDIDDEHLQRLLPHITGSRLLTSLSIKFRGTESAVTSAQASATISQATLQRLEFDMRSSAMSQIRWPTNFTLHYLKITECTFEQFCVILDHSPNLRTLVFRTGISDSIHETILKSYPQLTSLSFNDAGIFKPMGELKSILSITPSLKYLKVIVLISSECLLDGSEWESIIGTYLPRLNRFEFCFSLPNITNYNSLDLQSRMARYRTPFWIETKRWNVVCTFDPTMHRILVYSTPMCLISYSFISRYRKKAISIPFTITNFKTDLDIVSTISMTATTEQQPISSNYDWFENVTDLTVHIDGLNLPDPFDLFPQSVDPSLIVKLSLPILCYARSIRNTITNVVSLLERVYNVRSLSIFYRRSRNCPMVDIYRIYAVLPPRITHLTIEIMSVDDMEMLFERLVYLTSFTFVLSVHTKSFTAYIEWLRDNITDFTHVIDGNRIYVWLGNYRKKRKEFIVGSKRMKLSQNS